jgi:hypothetical protein
VTDVSEPFQQGEQPMSESNKALVARLIDDVFNNGRRDLIEAFYSPELAPAARRGDGFPVPSILPRHANAGHRSDC